MTDYSTYDDAFGDQQDYGMAGAFYSPEQLAMMQQLLGQGQPTFEAAGLDPTMSAMMGNQFLPQLDTKGRQQPYDLGYAAQLMNFGQDMGSSVGNNMMAYMSGPGAYAPGALDPVYDEKPYQVMEQRRLEMMRDGGGLQGVLADFIIGNPANGRQPMNPMQAAARVQAMLQDPEGHDLDPNEAAQMKLEIGTLQPQTNSLGVPVPGANKDLTDWNSLRTIAQSMYDPYSKELATLQSNPNIVQGADGGYVLRTQNDSPQMEWLKKMGLPDPRAEYDVKFALENDPSLVGMLGSVAQTQSERDMMRKEFEDRLKRTKKYREEDSKSAREMERFKYATQQAMSDYFGAASRGTAVRPAMPEGAGDWRPASPARMAADQEASRVPLTVAQRAAWNARLAQVSPEAEQYMRDPELPYRPSQAMDYLLGPQQPKQEEPDQPSMLSVIASARGDQFNLKPKADDSQYNMFRNVGDAVRRGLTGEVAPATLNLPQEPASQRLAMARMLTPAGRREARTRKVDEAIDPETRAKMYAAQMKGLDKKTAGAMFNYMMKLAPTVVAARQGRSPRTDAIQQRLAPLYQIGALGQR